MGPILLALAIAQAAAVPPASPAPGLAPTCAATDRNLPPELAGWTQTGERLTAGHAVVLHGTTEPTMPPTTRPGLVTHIDFSVPMGGRYGIALDQPGWIDVWPIMDHDPGRPAASIGHEHGPACSTIRKIVWYQLNAGSYYGASLSGLQNATVRIMLIAPPPPAPPAG